MKNKLVVMRVYERDAKRLRAKYPNYKSDAARLDTLLLEFDNMNASFYSRDPKDKLVITDSGSLRHGEPPTARLEVKSSPLLHIDNDMDTSGRIGTTMPSAILEVIGAVKK